MKTCKKCKKIKNLDQFPFRDRIAGTTKNECKECRSERMKAYVNNNKEKISEYKKEYRNNNKEIVAKKKSEFYFKNKEKCHHVHKRPRNLKKYYWLWIRTA
jgi:hypothetical protein